MKYEYRGRYERSDLQKTRLAIPYAEARVDKYRRLLADETDKLRALYRKQDELEKGTV